MCNRYELVFQSQVGAQGFGGPGAQGGTQFKDEEFEGAGTSRELYEKSGGGQVAEFDLSFETEPFQGYLVFDEFEGEPPRRPFMRGRRPPASPRRPPRRHPPRRLARRPRPPVGSRPVYPVFGTPAATLHISHPQGGDDHADQPFAAPDADAASVESADGQSEFYESEFGGWEWFDPEAYDADFEWMDEISRSSADYVRWVQQSLNSIMKAGLVVDGDSGPLTRAAVSSFQRRARITVDGIVGPQTEAALIAAGAGPPPAEAGGGSAVIDTLLPYSGPGYESKYGSSDSRSNQYARAETVQALQWVGKRWHAAHPNGPKFYIGPMSSKGGGQLCDPVCHQEHQDGLDIDIRPLRKDNVKGGLDITQKTVYSQPLTQELVDLFYSNPCMRVEKILFNDSNVRGVRWATNHDDHLHVSFYAPAGALPAECRSGYAGGTSPGAGGTQGTATLVNVPGIERTSQAFRDKVVRIAQDIRTDPNFLMAIMSFESSLNPQAVNDYSNATGLIQFMPETAKNLGTTTGALYRMSAEQQLDYVWKYFAPYKGLLRTLEDAYMAVLYPRGIGKGSAHVIFSTPSNEYEGNSVLDLDHDGRVTVAEATSMVRRKLPTNYPMTWSG